VACLACGTSGRVGMGTTHATSVRMAKEFHDEAEQEHVPSEKKLEQLYELIDGIETAMFTSQRSDGSLVSRPMQTQARRAGTDLWFMTSVDSGKVTELLTHPQVNLGYYKDGPHPGQSLDPPTLQAGLEGLAR
jgi:hypothetical protein